MLFSIREGIVARDNIVLNDLEENCKNRVYNNIVKFIVDYVENNEQIDLYYTIIDYMGVKIERELLELDNFYLLEELTKLFDRTWEYLKWYECLDCLEIIIRFKFSNEYAKRNVSKLTENINNVFEQEKSAYRIINKTIVAITSELELNELELAVNNPYKTVKDSIEKALNLYSDRINPDYKNSIKESITAVESMCCIICGDNKVTLGQALSKLENKGIYLHGAMKAGFGALYGYSSDATGIRHGGIDETKVTAEDAKYMLVSCTAFINYLYEKFSKLGG